MDVGAIVRDGTTSVAHGLPVRPVNEERTWTVIDEKYRTVAPVEEWLEAH
ncbi:hypothetical protein ACWCXX_34150 [Streptomyces sp. NPDC001732]